VLYFASSERWWIKHVVVPLLAGAGAVLILVAFSPDLGLHAKFGDGRRRPAETTATTHSPVEVVPESEPAVDSASGEAAHQAAQSLPETQATMPGGPAPGIQQPAIQSGTTKNHRITFYATDDRNHRFRGAPVPVRRGAPIRIHWQIDRTSTTGIIHLRSERDGRTVSDDIVESSGNRRIEPRDSMTLVLTEVRPTGEKFLANIDIAVK